MAKPLNTPRGLFAKKRIDIVSSGGAVSEVTADSTGLVLSKGVKISNKANAVLSGNSTGVVVSGGISPSGKAGQRLTANSTAIIASALAIGALASYITANSTGLKIGTRYISTNTTSNTTT